MKHITFKVIEDLLPNSTYLYDTNYNDNLDCHLQEIQEEINKPFSGHLDDLIDKMSITDSIEEYTDSLKEKLLESFSEKTTERALSKFSEEIEDYLLSKDKSDPIKDLLSNTIDEVLFYDFDVFIDDNYADLKERIRSIKKCLKIKNNDKKYDEELIELTENASYGGHLVIYFLPKQWEDFTERDENKENAITFYGDVEVAIIHTGNGSGFNVTLKDFQIKNLKLNNNKIKIDRNISYSYVYEVCGLVPSFCEDTKYKFEKIRKYKPLNESEIDSHMNEEREYDKTFKAGGCTTGDMNIKRHRNVFYINNYPCGNKCPHCNTFWID